MDAIEKQVSNSPPTREEAHAQFNYWTEKLGLKHTFAFDEVYDFMMERRRRAEFREQICAFEQRIKDHPDATGPDPFPLAHSFADGLYIRQVTVPAQTLTVTKIHAKTHAFFLLKGKISILTEAGVVHRHAPYSGITKAGTKRIIWHHDEVVFTTVHRTDNTNIEQIEAEVIAKTFDGLDDVAAARIQDFILEMKGNPCHL